MPSAAVRKRAERVVSLTSNLILPAASRPSRVRMNMASGSWFLLPAHRARPLRGRFARGVQHVLARLEGVIEPAFAVIGEQRRVRRRVGEGRIIAGVALQLRREIV